VKVSVTTAGPNVFASKVSRSREIRVSSLGTKPALLIKTSNLPNSFSTLSAAAVMVSAFVTSNSKKEKVELVFGYSDWSFDKAASPLIGSRAVMMM
jgi:hypothetical protein